MVALTSHHEACLRSETIRKDLPVSRKHTHASCPSSFDFELTYQNLPQAADGKNRLEILITSLATAYFTYIQA